MRYHQLLESNTTVYHGDSHGTTSLNSKWMLHGESNNQEGVGIYFSPDIKVAKSYGPKVSSIDISGLNIAKSRDLVTDIISQDDAIMLLSYLHKHSEDFWYMLTDYGIEIAEPEEVEEGHLYALHNMMQTQEVRNWQIELTQASDVVTFVTAWNKYIDIDALYETDSKFYAVINTSITATPVNF
jgi:hypothetical protein